MKKTPLKNDILTVLVEIRQIQKLYLHYIGFHIVFHNAILLHSCYNKITRTGYRGYCQEKMNIEIICIGKLKEKYWKDAIDDYSSRLNRYCRFHIIEMKESRLPGNPSKADEENVKKAEGTSILGALRERMYVIALDVQGRKMSSEQLAAHIEEHRNAGTGTMAFIIGGSLGLSEEVLRRADLRLSFSPMTFPHQMMRVILAEQIYRSFKIIHHETYHK